MENKTITNKKELLNIVEVWPTANVLVNYKFGGNEITLKYNNQSILYKSNSIKDVGYIALEFGGIGNEQYSQLSLKE